MSFKRDLLSRAPNFKTHRLGDDLPATDVFSVWRALLRRTQDARRPLSQSSKRSIFDVSCIATLWLARGDRLLLTAQSEGSKRVVQASVNV